MVRLRSVIESEHFARLCREIAPDVRRLDEQLRGVVWAIARNPEGFTRISGDFYVVETFMPLEGEEYVFIYYTIDDENTCTLQWIERGLDIVAGDDTTRVEVP
jgi:hypothetical protein